MEAYPGCGDEEPRHLQRRLAALSPDKDRDGAAVGLDELQLPVERGGRRCEERRELPEERRDEDTVDGKDA